MTSVRADGKLNHAALNEADAPKASPLPSRDYILLPLIVLATLLFLAGASEGIARLLWPEHQADACERSGGSGFVANCTSRVKIPEGPWVAYHYNDCGLRADRPCAKAPGALRVGVVGTSISSGFWTPFDQTFSGRLEQSLSQVCRTPVDFQTERVIGLGGEGGSKWSRIGDSLPAALALHPDALVTVMGPFDLEEYFPSKPATGLSHGPSRAGGAKAHAGLKGLFKIETLKSKFDGVLKESRAAYMAQHFFYLNLPRYLPLYLKHGDAADFLRPPFSPLWRARLDFADRVIRKLADQANTAHVPLIVVFMPNRAEIALAASPQSGVDAFALPDALREIVHRHGAAFVDVTQTAQGLKRQDDLFYLVDGHPAAGAHGLIAQALQPALIAGAPSFGRCRS